MSFRHRQPSVIERLQDGFFLGMATAILVFVVSGLWSLAADSSSTQWLGVAVYCGGIAWFLTITAFVAKHDWRNWLIFVLTVLVCVAVSCIGRAHATPAHAAPISVRPAVQVPAVAWRYRHQVETVVADVFGAQGSAARLAAQIHQESLWQPNARSPAGAEGMTQVMPATGRWLADAFHDQLGDYDPWDPEWSVRAAAVYDKYLADRNVGADACATSAFMFSAYNGGEKRLRMERTKAGAKSGLWFGATESQRARSLAAWRENRQYVSHILLVLEPAYIDAGWSGQVVCT